MRGLTVVMIVPTGIGAAIGGHSGDATLVAQLLGACCERLILHPNVVNASDMNEMPANALYVDGGMLDAFLEGYVGLAEVRRNKILVACNELAPDTVNAVNAAQSILGLDIEIVQIDPPLEMDGFITDNGATGEIRNFPALCDAVCERDFDALAIHTPIHVDDAVDERYRREGGVNPWGGIEAELSRLAWEHFGRPCAHAPLETSNIAEIVEPRLAPEFIGVHLMSVLKGLARAPRPVRDMSDHISVADVDALVSPMCWGRPHEACAERGIPVLLVEENTTITEAPPGAGDRVASYLEAAGWLTALRIGIQL